MQHNHKKTLKVALPGMNEKAQKMLAMYLQGPCKSAGVVIAGSGDAEVDIIDIDLPEGKNHPGKKADYRIEYSFYCLVIGEY